MHFESEKRKPNKHPTPVDVEQWPPELETMMNAKKFKSLLFLPASRLDMAQRAHERGADAIIIDLEDGIAKADRPAARNTLNTVLQALQNKGVQALVRINSLDNGGALDIEAIPDAFTPPLLLPKVSRPEQILAAEQCWVSCDKDLSTLQLLPMIECPKGMFCAEEIAAATNRVSAMVFGSEDFAAEAGISTDIDALAMPAQLVALAAAAAGIPAYGLPGSLGNYQDMELFAATLRRAKTIGFAGSLCIHPKQVLLANEVFQPSKHEIEWAEAVVAQSGAGGATGGDVGMVDAPVLARARAILAR
jgi:citrate lyase subunit beta/citryl-CoA lyase